MTAPSASYDRNRVMRIIEARIPELSDNDINALMQPDLPVEIVAQVLDVVEALDLSRFVSSNPGNQHGLAGLEGGAEGMLHWRRRFMKNINRSWT
jgi:hypothetical protein